MRKLKSFFALILTLLLSFSMFHFASNAENIIDLKEELLPESGYLCTQEEIDLLKQIDTEAIFEDNVVLVTFKTQFSSPDIKVTPEDFPELDVERVDNYSIADPDENYTKDVAIRLSEHDRNVVIEACNDLNDREDILYAIPSYGYKVDSYAVPNDTEFC